MVELWQDLRFAARTVTSRPGFGAAVVLSVVLGIGVNTALFTLLDRVFWRPIPIREPDRLVAVFGQIREPSGEYTGRRSLSHANYLDLRERNRTLETVALYQWMPLNLTGAESPERLTGMFVTADYFKLLGLEPRLGRFFRPDEDAVPGLHPVAVLSYGGWHRLFGGDPEVVGRTVQINGRTFTVIGVGPPGFKGTELEAAVEVWVPVMMFPEIAPWADFFEIRGVGLFRVLGRLADGVGREQAEADLSAIAAQLEQEHPKENEQQGAMAVLPLLEASLHPDMRDGYVGYARTLAIPAALILLISCINVATLLLVRGLDRGHEIALRRAVGASRSRTVRQLLTETLLLFTIGGLLSLPLAHWTLSLFWSFRPTQLAADALDLGLDSVVFGFALLTAVVTGLLFGVVPALRATRIDLVRQLRDSPPLGTGGEPRPGWRLRSGLVVAQVALALWALVGAGLYLRSLINAQRIDLGFDAERLAVMTVTPGDQGYEPAEAIAFYRRLREELVSLPGIEAVGASENRLLRGAVFQRQVFLPGTSSEEATTIHGRAYHRSSVVLPGFFAAVGIELLEGSDFASSLPEDGPEIAIINATMARTLWPGESAIGKRFHFDYPSEPPVEVVGVVSDARYRQIQEQPQFFIYRPIEQRYVPAMTLHVRTHGDPAATLPTLRRRAASLDPHMPIADLHPMRTYVEQALWLERTSAMLLGVFAGLAVLLAVVGVFGIVSYSVRQRRHEIGIRISLGAARSDVLRSILGQAAKLVALGLVIGTGLSYFALRSLSAGQLHEIDPGDPLTYASVILTFVAVALLGSLLAARQALRTDPARVLRAE